jgi:hypothetical protein
LIPIRVRIVCYISNEVGGGTWYHFSFVLEFVYKAMPLFEILFFQIMDNPETLATLDTTCSTKSLVSVHRIRYEDHSPRYWPVECNSWCVGLVLVYEAQYKSYPLVLKFSLYLYTFYFLFSCTWITLSWPFSLFSVHLIFVYMARDVIFSLCSVHGAL